MQGSQSQRKRPRCAICGSRRFQRDHDSGSVICDQGHLQADATQEVAPSETRTGARVYKRSKGTGKARKQKEEKHYYVGARARFLLVQCFQILLRKQIAALRQAFSFPAELELIARELWASYVSLLDLEAVPLEADVELESQALSQRADSGSEEPESASRQRPDADDGTSDDSDDDAQSSVFLSGTQERPKKDQRKAEPWEAVRARYTLVICYLSLITLRYPIMVNDLRDWVSERRIPYLQALDDIPEDMRKLLPLRSWEDVLDPHLPAVASSQAAGKSVFVDQADTLAIMIARFIQMYDTKCGVTFPTLNVAPMLWRCVRTFALSPLMYERAKDILALTGVDLSHQAAEQSRGAAAGQSTFLPNARVWPREIYLVAAVLLCIRLVWGTEEEERLPMHALDPLASLFPRTELLTAIERIKQLEESQSMQAVWRKPLHQLEDDEIDRYLDYLQGLLPQPSRPPKHRRAIERLFPLPKLSGKAEGDASDEVDEYVAAFYNRARPPPVTALERAKGSKVDKLAYTVFAISQANDEMPLPFEQLLARGEALIGIPRSVIFRIMQSMETALLKNKEPR